MQDKQPVTVYIEIPETDSENKIELICKDWEDSVEVKEQTGYFYTETEHKKLRDEIESLKKQI